MLKTIKMQRVEERHGATLEELICQLSEEGYSREQIARHLDISYWTLDRWLDMLGARFKRTVTFEPVDNS